MKRRPEGSGKAHGQESSPARSPRGAARAPADGGDATERTVVDPGRRATPGRSARVPPAPRSSHRAGDDDGSRARTQSGLRDAHTVRVGRPDLEPRTLRSSSTEVPPTAQRYRDDGEIAGGGMGSIRRVFDRVILREVARKTLHASAAGIPGAAALLLEEAQITGQLDHPNIVPVYDVQADGSGGAAHFTLKLVRGETLKVLAKGALAGKPEPARLERLLKVFVKVCDAVAFAHDRGVIHRDLKPDNVMVGTHGQVYVMDWGIAMLRGGRPSTGGAALRTTGRAQAHKTGAAIGTPGYMAPEQAWGGEIDERTDVFGLGAILYRMLTDRSPWASRAGKDAVELAKEGVVTPPERRAPGRSLPPELCRIAMKAMAKDPNERYATVDALKEDVEEVLRGGGWFSAKSFRAGEAIVRQGDAAGAAYIITDGHCQAIRTTGGKKTLLRRMGPGEVFGEMAIFTSQPRAATVVAETAVTVLVITPEAMEQAFGKSSWVRAFVSALAWRFLDADAQLRGGTGR